MGIPTEPSTESACAPFTTSALTSAVARVLATPSTVTTRLPLDTATVTTLPDASTVHVEGGPRPLPGVADGSGGVESTPDGAVADGAEIVAPPSPAAAVVAGEDDVPLVPASAAPVLMLPFGAGAIELSVGSLGVEEEIVGPGDGAVVVTSVAGATGSPSVEGVEGAIGVDESLVGGGTISSLEGVVAGGTTVSFEMTGAVAFAIVRVAVCSGALAIAACCGATAFCGAGAGTRSSGDAGCVTVLGSTSGAGCVVEPGASVVGSLPTPASVVAGGVDGAIAMGVPVSSVVTVACAIADASASTTGADV